MTKIFCSFPVAVLLILHLALLAGMILDSPYELLNENVKLGNLEQVRLLITPATRAELDATGQPFNVDDEQAIKRRRLNEAADCIDPSYDSNMAIYLAVEYGHHEIVDLLLNDPRVKTTLDLEDLLNLAIDFHHNHIALRILEEPSIFSLEHAFVRTCENNNIEFLEMLVTPDRLGRLNLINSVPTAVDTLEDEECGEILYFFMTCPHIQVLHFDRTSILYLAMKQRYDNVLSIFFSDPHYAFDTVTIIEALMIDRDLSLIMMLAHPNVDIEAFENETGYHEENTSVRHFKEVADLQGEELTYTVDYFHLAIACLQNSVEKVEYVLEHIKTWIPKRLVNMLLKVCCMTGKSHILHILLRNSTVCWSADKEALDSLTEMLLRQGDSLCLKLVLAALCHTDQDLGMNEYILAGLKEPIDDGKEVAEQLDALHRISSSQLELAEEYQKNGHKWLAALIRASVAHHNAISTIAARPFHFPPEITDMIMMHELLNLESFYRD